MGFGLVVAGLLVAANGFFVAAEFAIARLRPTQVAALVREARPGARSAEHAVEHIDAYLSACQLGITLASLGLGAVGESALHDLLEPLLGDASGVAGFGLATAAAFAVITVAHVVLGELAPKSAAISRTVPVALVVCPPMRAFYLATKPLVDLFNAMGNLVLRPFGIPPASEAGHAPHSEDELHELLGEAHEGGELEAEETRLSQAALVFGDRPAGAVMRPADEIDHLTTADDREAAIRRAAESGRTRLPVVERAGDLGSAIGVLHVKDLLTSSEPDLRALARPLRRVGEGTPIGELLLQMRSGRRHMALVVDDADEVTGLITLEDVIEELVGTIDDEFDEPADGS